MVLIFALGTAIGAGEAKAQDQGQQAAQQQPTGIQTTTDRAQRKAAKQANKETRPARKAEHKATKRYEQDRLRSAKEALPEAVERFLELAQEDWRPSTVTGDLTLQRALELAFEQDPAIQIDQESARFQLGLYEAARGRFDNILTADLEYEQEERELRGSTKQREQDRRDDRRDELEAIRSELALGTMLEAGLIELQQDPDNFRVEDATIQPTIDLFNESIRTAGPSARQNLIDQRDDAIERALEAVSGEVVRLTDREAERAQQLADLGEIPQEERLFFGRFNTQYLMPTRSGFSWGPFFEYTIDGDRFIGKEIDRDLGGKDIQDVYRGTLGFTFDTPLLRGFGKRENAAVEAAAALELKAALLQLRHGASVTALAVIERYWRASFAADREAIFQQSLALEEDLVALVTVLADAEEIARAEVTRAQASMAEAEAALLDARRSSIAERFLLAETLGIAIADSAHTPGATTTPRNDDAASANRETLTGRLAQATRVPTPTDRLTQIDALANASGQVELSGVDLSAAVETIDASVARRRDLGAALLATEAGRLIETSSRLRLKPRLDLGGRFFYNALAEQSGNDALGGRWVGPSYSAAFELEWPIANNVQRGQYRQAEADRKQRDLFFRDLERLIRIRIRSLVSEVQEVVSEINHAETATRLYGESLQAEIERLQLGMSTVIDTIFLEQRLTDSRLRGLDARLALALRLAQLKFETATLIRVGEGGPRAAAIDAGLLLSLPTPKALSALPIEPTTDVQSNRNSDRDSSGARP